LGATRSCCTGFVFRRSPGFFTLQLTVADPQRCGSEGSVDCGAATSRWRCVAIERDAHGAQCGEMGARPATGRPITIDGAHRVISTRRALGSILPTW
jgi:hypothetical protein